MIMELMARGDLKTLLRNSRPKVRMEQSHATAVVAVVW